MNLPVRQPSGPPRLTVVRGTHAPVSQQARADWQRVARAVLACTHELSRHLLEQRWGRVMEAISERRELLECMGALQLDVDGKRSLLALRQAADESEAAIHEMMGETRRRR
jgi:NurA-like 5'-3' nuclease